MSGTSGSTYEHPLDSQGFNPAFAMDNLDYANFYSQTLDAKSVSDQAAINYAKEHVDSLYTILGRNYTIGTVKGLMTAMLHATRSEHFTALDSTFTDHTEFLKHRLNMSRRDKFGQFTSQFMVATEMLAEGIESFNYQQFGFETLEEFKQFTQSFNNLVTDPRSFKLVTDIAIYLKEQVDTNKIRKLLEDSGLDSEGLLTEANVDEFKSRAMIGLFNYIVLNKLFPAESPQRAAVLNGIGNKADFVYYTIDNKEELLKICASDKPEDVAIRLRLAKEIASYFAQLNTPAKS